MNHHDSDRDLDHLGDALRAATTVDLANEHSARTAGTPAPAAASRLLRRPRILAGSTLGLAGVGAALVVALSTSGAQPAFAVTPHPDGSVFVTLKSAAGISGANRKLASMGIHQRLFASADHSKKIAKTAKPAKTAAHHHVAVSTSASSTRTLSVANYAQSCLQDERTGRDLVVLFPTVKEQQAAVSTGTYVPPADAGNTGGVPNPDTFKVIPCSSMTTGNSGSGGTGNTGS